jgi:hypothetical protein
VSQSSPVPTEEIHQAFVAYRALFTELLDDRESEGNGASAEQSSAASFRGYGDLT